jgi:hypothetical protein
MRHRLKGCLIVSQTNGSCWSVKRATAPRNSTEPGRQSRGTSSRSMALRLSPSRRIGRMRWPSTVTCASCRSGSVSIGHSRGFQPGCGAMSRCLSWWTGCAPITKTSCRTPGGVLRSRHLQPAWFDRGGARLSGQSRSGGGEGRPGALRVPHALAVPLPRRWSGHTTPTSVMRATPRWE